MNQKANTTKKPESDGGPVIIDKGSEDRRPDPWWPK